MFPDYYVAVFDKNNNFYGFAEKVPTKLYSDGSIGFYIKYTTKPKEAVAYKYEVANLIALDVTGDGDGLRAALLPVKG